MRTAKYKEIYETLREDIQSGKYPAKTYLPKEGELMEMYGASRDTIRKSLSLLAEKGFIQKENGVGSIVLEDRTRMISFPVAGLTSFKELASESMHGSVDTEVSQFENLRADEKLAGRLDVKPGTEVLYVERIREIDGERVIIDRDWLNAELIPGLTKEQMKDSLYEYIEGTLGMPVSFARKEITVIPASHQDRELLDLQDNDLVVCVRSYNYLENAQLFDYSESRHRPDKFRFVDFSRREKMSTKKPSQS